MDLSIRVIAIMLFCDRSHFASRHPHLSVVQVVKEHFPLRQTQSPSAAQKRDYEPLPYFRQALQKIFFPQIPDFSPPLPLLLQPPLSLAAAGEGRILRIFQPPSIAFLKIVELAIQHRDYCQLTKP
jgi:hypothetical protein